MSHGHVTITLNQVSNPSSSSSGLLQYSLTVDTESVFIGGHIFRDH